MFLHYYFQSLSSSYVAVTLVFGESFTRETTLFYNTTVSQNQRLTKTLLFVSAAAVFCWLPYVIVDCLRWLDIVFQGQYLPSLSVNWVAINKDLEKLTPQLY